MRYFFVFAVVLVLASSIGAASVFADTTAEKKAQLEQQLQNVERQMLKQQVLVEDTQLQRQSLERDIKLLNAQIDKAKLGIKARTIAIEQLAGQITDKQGVVDELNAKLDRQRQSLAQLIRKTKEIDDYSLAEVMLGNQNFSQFFDEFQNFQSIKSSLNDSLDVMKQLKSDTEDQKASLESKQLSEAQMKQMQEDQKQQIESKETDKNKILTVTKGKEAAYQQLLEAQQKTASQLRQELFALAGGGAKIPFPQAVSLASFASAKTGVSAAFILAILKQESEYGTHIGSCVYNDVVQGKPVMHPDRDQPVFKVIANVVGFDPTSQQVSCPWIRSGERIGWGGAMGPSQFIPSTWAIYGGIVKDGSGGWTYDKGSDMIRQLTGKTSPSSPFDNQDAFMATALYMRDLGAGAGTYKAMWTAAIRYFAGYGGASNPINFPYGDNVMANEQTIEKDIKTLQGG